MVRRSLRHAIAKHTRRWAQRGRGTRQNDRALRCEEIPCEPSCIDGRLQAHTKHCIRACSEACIADATTRPAASRANNRISEAAA